MDILLDAVNDMDVSVLVFMISVPVVCWVLMSVILIISEKED